MKTWRMPRLAPAKLSRASRLWMLVLRSYLVVAGGLVLARIAMLAFKWGLFSGSTSLFREHEMRNAW